MYFQRSVTLLPLLLAMAASAQSGPQRPSFMERGKLLRHDSHVTVISNDPRPLSQAIETLREENGWIVDYEDPLYSTSFDLVDDTDPNWRREHPNEKGVTRIAGGFFKSEFEHPRGVELNGQNEEQILRKVVADYNSSGNPGKFLVKNEGDRRLAIVGVAVRGNDGQFRALTPLLDTRISIGNEQRNAMTAITEILKSVSDSSGVKVTLGVAPINVLLSSTVTAGGANIAARDLLAQVLDGTKNAMNWRLFYDADTSTYYLNIELAIKIHRDSNGNEELMPVTVK